MAPLPVTNAAYYDSDTSVLTDTDIENISTEIDLEPSFEGDGLGRQTRNSLDLIYVPRLDCKSDHRARDSLGLVWVRDVEGRARTKRVGSLRRWFGGRSGEVNK
jgi:hypothetical protein